MKKRKKLSIRIFQVVIVLLILFSLIFIGLKSKISGFVSHDRVLVSTKLQPPYPVTRGSLITLEVSLYQSANIGSRDVLIDYYLMGNGIRQKVRSETIALDSSLSTVLNIEIPPTIKGDMINLEVQILDPETKEIIGIETQKIILYDGWSVVFSKSLLAFLAIALIIIAIMLLIILFFKCRKMMKNQVIPSRSAEVKLN